MKVLFTTYGTRPHYFPLVPLAWAFHSEGHDVRVAGPPALTEPLRESGLLGVLVGEDADVSAFLRQGAFRRKSPVEGEDAEATLRRFVAGIAPIASLRSRAMEDDLIAFARDWRPDLVVYDPTTFAGAVVAQVLGIPAVCHTYGMSRQFRIELEGLVGPEPTADYAALFERHGVDVLIEPAAWVEPCPPGLRWVPASEEHRTPLDAPRHSIRYIRFNGSGFTPPDVLEPTGRRRVVVTLGPSQEQKLGPDVLVKARTVVGAAAELDVEVVATVGGTSEQGRAYLEGMPPNVRTVPWVPLHLLADAADVLVHTGGTGTMLTTAACGRPQLGISTMPYAVFNSEQLAQAKAGLHVPAAEVDADRIRSAVADLLDDPSFAEGSRALREEIEAQPSPAEVVHELEGLAG
ncbi:MULTISPECIES: glycosyltransferase [unclassified Nocardiopsis]|uniref:glycosyltransferase n=1 Tax=Nocardiopsis TaxID=2013 RepID=UPI00387B6FBC